MLFALTLYEVRRTSPLFCRMTEDRHLKQWLTEYKSLSSSDIPAYATKISTDDQLISSICNLLGSGSLEHLAPVYSQLFEFYKSSLLDLQRFTLQFIPVIIFQYLKCSFSRTECGPMEALLLGIYNLAALEVDGTSRAEVVRIPSLGKPSIYHEPSIQLAISDHLNLHQESEHRLVTRAPLPELDSITAHNRFLVMNELLRLFNGDIGFYHHISFQFFCKTCSEICKSGFQRRTKDLQERIGGDLELNLSFLEPRIPINSEFLTELLQSLYYIIFNGFGSAGQEALEAIHFRAQHEMFSDVLLVTNAIKHSLDTNPSGGPQDGPVGINIALTPASPLVTRAPITGASFKSSKSRVTIESISTIPTTDGTDTVQNGKQTDSMHRLVVANNQRHKLQGKGHGSVNREERKVGASNNDDKNSAKNVSKNGKDTGNHQEHMTSNSLLIGNGENVRSSDDRMKGRMKENLELNLSSIETSF
ncbi:hyccin-like isoform X2 [Apostichopus japonicus]|uniref:hyccin-like isoform X2 n=1 Tax=Stichopus japonicus TaxID=307972 RepID=UPI003AB58EBE